MDYLASIQHLDLQLSRNPIVVLVDPVILDAEESRVDLRYFLELRMQTAFQGNQFTTLPLQEASEKPIPDGYTSSPGAYFEVQTRLDDQLLATPPKYLDHCITICPNLTRQYYCVSQSYNGDDLVETVQSTTLWTIRAQIAMRHYSMYKDVFFTEFMGGKVTRFLTWQPDNKLVRIDQPERLYFLTNFTPSPTSLLLRVRVNYDDDSSDTFTAKTVTDVSPMTVYCCPVGFAELGLGELPKTVLTYQVWLSNENTRQVSEVREFRVDRFEYETVKYLLFQNSLGGYDTLRCVGSPSENVSVSRQLLERYTDYDYLPTVSQVLINNTTGQRQISLNVGNWLSSEHREYLEDLLLSEDFYIVDQQEFIPLLPEFSSLTTQSVTEWPIARVLPFSFANDFGGYSRLPKFTAPVRPTSWRQWSISCELDAKGIRTGRQMVNELVKFFTDSGENVRPLTTKANVTGTEGYISPWASDACLSSTTPFFNTAIAAPSTFKRSNCTGGKVGGVWTITVPAGSYGSEISVADAQAKALAAWKSMDTQGMANTNGTCINPVNIRIGLLHKCSEDLPELHNGMYVPVAAVLMDGFTEDSQVITNTTYNDPNPNYSWLTFPAGIYNFDVRVLFPLPPTHPYKLSIPSKFLATGTLNGVQTYRFANVEIKWGDPDLIIVIEYP